MKWIVVSNRPSRRTEYWLKAAREMGREAGFITYEALQRQWPGLQDAVVKLEPWASEETDYLRYAQTNRDYRAMLHELSTRTQPGSVRFLNTPEALLLAADKLASKARLQEAGLTVTPLVGIPHSFDELKELLAGCPRGCFLKPRYGSGAGGILAIRYQSRTGRWVAYTTLQTSGGRIHNTKRINRLTRESDIALLAEAVIHTEAIVEEWIPKADWEGVNYDLRIVCREDAVDYTVVRCSQGAITNLHLNNYARRWDELPLDKSVRQAVERQSIRASRAIGLHYAGIDLLLERDRLTPVVIEVNGQGDHIYQDMFDANLIYKNQFQEPEPDQPCL